MPRISLLATLPAALCLLTAARAPACTNILVTKGASADGSIFVTYTCDGEFHPRLMRTPAADYAPGEMLEIRHWDGKVYGAIPQVPHTYAVVGLMNEHQLAIAETTFDGRLELENPQGLLHYWDLMHLALQRARTAREAVQVITSLVTEHGYRSTGESISIGDPHEAWLLEIIGPGPGGRGAHWVALRIPDGTICAHANKAVIGEFPLNDPETCLSSPDVIKFAIARGYYDPASGQPFRFNEAYNPSTPRNQRYGAARVWSIFRRAAPSLNLSPDYHRAVPGAAPYPLWVKPDAKLALADVFALLRDHYEGTDIDMTQGVDAGPYGTPNRGRPINWHVDGVEYTWERPVSTPQTGFTCISQSRAWLPDPIGGCHWYAVDDTYFCCYVPLYCGIDALPEAYTVGGLERFSWDSAWWVFNFVANYANLRYADMRVDIQAVQRELEGHLLALQPAVEQTALALHERDAVLMQRYLTDYSVSHAEQVVKRWRQLGEDLIRKYNDGYVQTAPGQAEEQGYPEAWLRHVVRTRPGQFRLPDKPEDVPESKLVD